MSEFFFLFPLFLVKQNKSTKKFFVSLFVSLPQNLCIEFYQSLPFEMVSFTKRIFNVYKYQSVSHQFFFYHKYVSISFLPYIYIYIYFIFLLPLFFFFSCCCCCCFYFEMKYSQRNLCINKRFIDHNNILVPQTLQQHSRGTLLSLLIEFFLKKIYECQQLILFVYN